MCWIFVLSVVWRRASIFIKLRGKCAIVYTEIKLIVHKNSNNFPIAAGALQNDLKLNESVLLSCVQVGRSWIWVACDVRLLWNHRLVTLQTSLVQQHFVLSKFILNLFFMIVSTLQFDTFMRCSFSSARQLSQHFTLFLCLCSYVMATAFF